MRIVCVHPARDPVLCADGPVRIGSAPDDAIALDGVDVSPHHVTLVADARGLVLAVRPGCARVYVNARVVREKAILRYGDSVTLGTNKFLVTTDTAPPPADAVAGRGTLEGRAALRVVSGAASGQALAIAPELRFGPGTRHFRELAYAGRVTQTADGLAFESGSTAPRINGWHGSSARLSPGDQIVLGEYRLVVEAPVLQHAAHVPAPAPPEVEDDAAPATPAHTEAWWLIVAAAVLAALIALFLSFRW